MSQSLDQAAIDEAIALGLDLDFDNLYLTSNDPDEIALMIKQKEEALSTQADEEYARMLQLEEEELLVQNWPVTEANHPSIHQPDVPSSSRGTTALNDGDSSDDENAIENNNPDNGTGESSEEVSKEGLPEDVISRLPTQKYGQKTWWSLKKAFVPEKKECSICMSDYEKGDEITMLPCKHVFHKDCISQWLKDNKVCCECQAEVKP